VAVVALWLASVASARAAEPFKVIVNARMTGHVISKQSIGQAFLGRAERWSDGRPIAPVDLSTTSAVRSAFSQSVLDMTVLAVRQYWTRTLASGHFPPPVRTTDEDVIAFVAGRVGAIGYVSADALLPDTVRAVAVQ